MGIFALGTLGKCGVGELSGPVFLRVPGKDKRLFFILIFKYIRKINLLILFLLILSHFSGIVAYFQRVLQTSFYTTNQTTRKKTEAFAFLNMKITKQLPRQDVG